jgi:predicted metal-dependent peptidase
MSKAQTKRHERRQKARAAGWATVRQSTVLGPVADHVHRRDESLTGADTWAVIDECGYLTVNEERDGEPGEWAWVFAHLLLHLGLGHTDAELVAEARGLTLGGDYDPTYAAACCVAVARFAESVRLGSPLTWVPELPGDDELSLTRRWRDTGVPPALTGLGTNGTKSCLRLAGQTSVSWRKPPVWDRQFAHGLADAATEAMISAAESRGQTAHLRPMREWDHALSWFASSYPLLGAVAAGFTLVADADVARAWDIRVAAVSPEHGEIYVNPHASLEAEEWRFVLAHEMLHAALGHDRRAGGREPYLWNVACDYVINGWLVAMGVGQLPDSTLYDQQLTGLSAESVYDTLTTDLRRARKLRTLGAPAGDVLGDWLSEPDAVARRGSRRVTARAPWDRAGNVDLDDFYRRALTQGLEYHHVAGRGLLPAGLVEEIRTLDHPPLPWDAQLARWFDEHIRAPEPRRTYARASRRQAATPDIPRPGKLRPEELARELTFGVVLDTSGSMPRELLGKALGAIASYATARDVPAARVVFCDAVAYDAGYLAPSDIAGSVKIRGRGGTVLQPGVHLLERAPDFPRDGPILVITDGECDRVRVRREHAFLVPVGARLPFMPKGPVFRVS